MGIKPRTVAIFVMLAISAAWSQDSDGDFDDRYDSYTVRKSRLYEPRKKKKDRASKNRQLRKLDFYEDKEKSFPKISLSQSLVSQKLEKNTFPFDLTPVEINLYFLSALPTSQLLKFRCINKYWKILAEDVLYRNRRCVTIDVSKINLKKMKDNFQFPFKIYELKMINFKQAYQSKFKAFMKAFSQKDQVMKLSFSGNRFGERRLNFIYPFLQKFENIEVLDLSYNHMQTLDLSLLCCTLPSLKNLKLINLENNLIYHFNSMPWVYYLQNFPSLQSVYCSHQYQIIYENKKRGYKKLDKVIVPSPEGSLIKMIFMDTPIEYAHTD